jgi:Phage-related protein, tail component
MNTELDVSTGQLRTIRLYGKLGVRFGRVHRMAVDSAAEAIRALGSQHRGFDAYLTQSKDNGMGYAVFYGKNNLSEQELHNPVARADEIRIAPIILGNKNGGIFQIILGAVLVVVGVVVTGMTFGGAAAIGGALVGMGVSMIVGGVIQLLSPSPKGRSSEDRPENKPGYSFNGPLNTQAQGNPLAVLYGELIVGSAVLSAGINAVDQVYIPTSTPGSGSGGGGGGGSPPWHMEQF